MKNAKKPQSKMSEIINKISWFKSDFNKAKNNRLHNIYIIIFLNIIYVSLFIEISFRSFINKNLFI